MATLTKQLADIGAALGLAAATYQFNESAVDNYEFQNVKNAASSLRSAVDEMIALDEAEANGFWTEVMAWVRHGWNREAERERFNREVQVLTGEIYDALDSIDEYVADAEINAAHVPDELYASAREWATTARNIGTVRSDISGLMSLASWGGTAADNYASTARVQANATQELSGVATGVSHVLIALGNFNCAIFQAAAARLTSASQAVSFTRPFDGGGGKFYIRAASFVGEVNACERDLYRILLGHELTGPAEDLQADVSAATSAPVLLKPGQWPTGGGQAAIPPGSPHIPNPNVPDPFGFGGMCYPPEEGLSN